MSYFHCGTHNEVVLKNTEPYANTAYSAAEPPLITGEIPSP